MHLFYLFGFHYLSSCTVVTVRGILKVRDAALLPPLKRQLEAIGNNALDIGIFNTPKETIMQ